MASHAHSGDFDEAVLDRAAGVLLGAALGDALGAGYEFSYPDSNAVIDLVGGGPFDFEPAEWTDDTSMALVIAQVAANGDDLHQGRGLDAIAAGFVAWYESHPKDVGNQTRKVLSKLPKDAAAMRAISSSLPGLKGGNGSLMRTSPVALSYLADPVGLVRAAGAISDLTHYYAPARQACQLWSFAIGHAVVHGNYDGVRTYLELVDDEVSDYWRPLIDEAETGSPEDFPDNGWVVHALQTAWWAISTTEEEPGQVETALTKAVRAGGDTDTVAAIAGGLVGGRWGSSAIAAERRDALHGWPGLTGPDLAKLAERIVLSRPAPTSTR
jgi:ADP-ribosyl-[dinitrogen reductase] hydrolase